MRAAERKFDPSVTAENGPVSKNEPPRCTLVSAGWTLWVGARTAAIVIWIVPVLAVLRHVAMHVVQAPGIRMQMAHGMNAVV